MFSRTEFKESISVFMQLLKDSISLQLKKPSSSIGKRLMLLSSSLRRLKTFHLILFMMDLPLPLEHPIMDTLLQEQSRTWFAVMPLKQVISSPEGLGGIATDFLFNMKLTNF